MFCPLRVILFYKPSCLSYSNASKTSFLAILTRMCNLTNHTSMLQLREMQPRTQMLICKKWFSGWCLSCSGHFIFEHLPEDCCPIEAEMMDVRDNWLAMTTLTMQGHISISQLLETAKQGRQSGIIRCTPRMVKRQAKTHFSLLCTALSWC